MIFVISKGEVYRMELSASDSKELLSFLSNEKMRYDSCVKKPYSMSYKKEEDELFHITNYKVEMQKAEDSKKIIGLLDAMLSSSTTTFPKINLKNILSIDAVVFKFGNKLYIQSSFTTKIITSGAKILIDTESKINKKPFLSVGNKINAMYDGSDLCLDNTYGLGFLELSRFVRELTAQEIHASIPKHIECPVGINLNRASTKMLSVAVQEQKYFTPAHLQKTKKIASSMNPKIDIPYKNGKLYLPQNDPKTVERIMSVILDRIFQSNYSNAELVKANSVERIKN